MVRSGGWRSIKSVGFCDHRLVGSVRSDQEYMSKSASCLVKAWFIETCLVTDINASNLTRYLTSKLKGTPWGGWRSSLACVLWLISLQVQSMSPFMLHKDWATNETQNALVENRIWSATGTPRPPEVQTSAVEPDRAVCTKSWWPHKNKD